MQRPLYCFDDCEIRGERFALGVRHQWSRTEIIANGPTIGPVRGLFLRLAANERSLCAIGVSSQSGVSSGFATVIVDRVPFDTWLDLWPYSVVPSDGRFLISGRRPRTGTHAIVRIENGLAETVLESSEAVFALQGDGQAVVYRLKGSVGLRCLFLACHRVASQPRVGPLLNLGNAEGRLSYTVAPYLMALAIMGRYSPRAKEHAARVARRLSAAGGLQGRYPASRYSLENVTFSYAILDALIHVAILDATPASSDEARNALRNSVQCFDYYEGSFDGHLYRLPTDAPHRTAGLPLPVNQQAAIGLLALRLYVLTGSLRYRTRVDQLMRLFSESMIEGDVPVWSYNHMLFTKGWKAGEVVAPHWPAKGPERPVPEDVVHAYLGELFLSEANAVVGAESPYCLDDIADRLLRDGLETCLFLDRSGDRSYAHYPCFPTTISGRAALAGVVAAPALWLEDQRFLLGQARAFESAATSDGDLEVELMNADCGKFLRTCVLGDARQVLRFWEEIPSFASALDWSG